MSKVTTTSNICDRCGEDLGIYSRKTMTVNYHHPVTLDLCKTCEGEFMLWLGQHPLWKDDFTATLAGRSMGDGYPSRERINGFLDRGELTITDRHLKALKAAREEVGSDAKGHGPVQP